MGPIRRGRMRAAGVIGLLTAVLALVPAGPAAADPAGPTHYRSTVDAVQGEGAEHLEVEIVGGDAFLVLRADPGVEVRVPGYDGEPYLRFDEQGVVWRNERSPAQWLNAERYGASDTGELPPVADAEAAPSWQRIAEGGEYAWHDHRVHYMTPSFPRNVDPNVREAQPVLDWEVRVTVDDEPVEIQGELVWLPGPSTPLVFWLVAGLLGVALGLALPRYAGAMLGLGAVAAVGIGASTVASAPTGAEADLAFVVLPAVAVAACAAALALRGRGDRRGRWLLVAGAFPLLAWTVVLAGAVSRPIVPGPLPTVVVRSVVLLSVTVAVAVLTAELRSLTRTRVTTPEVAGEDPEARG